MRISTLIKELGQHPKTVYRRIEASGKTLTDLRIAGSNELSPDGEKFVRELFTTTTNNNTQHNETLSHDTTHDMSRDTTQIDTLTARVHELETLLAVADARIDALTQKCDSLSQQLCDAIEQRKQADTRCDAITSALIASEAAARMALTQQKSLPEPRGNILKRAWDKLTKKDINTGKEANT